MPPTFNYGRYVFSSTADSWWQIANMIYENGDVASPRKLGTREVISANLMFMKPWMNYVNPKGRNLNLPFAIVEFTDYLQGRNPGNAILFNSQLSAFINPITNKFDGAYGPRIKPIPNKTESSQFFRCFNELKSDPDSRRAVITIHNPCYENFAGKDVACTLSLQFLLRDAKLNMITTMRSEDVFLGFCYDTFEFQLMQRVMASLLNVGVGHYYHNVGSLHLYTTDFEKLKKIDPLAIPYENGEIPAEIGYADYGEFERDLTILEFIAGSASLTAEEQASKTVRDYLDDIIDAPHHISSPYFINCGLVVAADVMRRLGRTEDAKTLAREINNEFRNYFSDKFGWA